MALVCIRETEDEPVIEVFPWTDTDRDAGEIYLTMFEKNYFHGNLHDFLARWTEEIFTKVPEMRSEFIEIPDQSFSNPELQRMREQIRRDAGVKIQTKQFKDPEAVFIHCFKERVFDHPDVIEYLRGPDCDWEIRVGRYHRRTVKAVANPAPSALD